MMRNDVLDLIERVAKAMGDELERVVFVGGAVASLYEEMISAAAPLGVIRMGPWCV